MQGIALIGPKIEYIRGIPNATEFPKQLPSPNNAQSSVLKLKIFLLKKNPIIKIIIPDPKKTNNNSIKNISGNFIRQKLLINAIGNKILKQIKVEMFHFNHTQQKY